MNSAASTPTTVVLIGPAIIPELAELLHYLQSHPALIISSHLESIADFEATSLPDVVIVLQSYSDQYGASAVNRLVEMTLGRRLFCCYGPWCVSDGRSHDIWPQALRIPVDEFREFLQRELEFIAAGKPPLPPTASGEELFGRWFGQSATQE